MYIQIENDVIRTIYCGRKLLSTDVWVDDDFEGRAYDNIKLFNADWRYKELSVLAKENLITISNDYKIIDDQLVRLTLEEKVENGSYIVPPEFKIVDGHVVHLTLAEMVEKGLHTLSVGFKIVGEDQISMTLSEKVEAGLEIIPAGFKIVGNEFAAITVEEQLELGQITLADYEFKQSASVLQREEQALVSYLADTDWYPIRFSETGADFPLEIRQLREHARQRISEIRDSNGNQ